MGQSVAGVLLAGLLLVGGCGGEPAESVQSEDGVLSPVQFVEIVASLRAAERAAAEADSTEPGFEERRDEILTRHDVSEDDLLRFLEAHGENTDLLYVVWDSINERLKRAVDPGEDPMERRTGPRAF